MVSRKEPETQTVIDEDQNLDDLNLKDIDIMEDFGGYLDARKRENKMPRDTDMSQLDGLVSNL